jgi:type IV fimbrial biogenesis protein FimT
MLIGYTLRGAAQRGVTLIELMLALIVLSVLVALGVPSFQAWLQNAQIRNAADAVMNGITLARTEAVRRNRLVYFTFDGGSNWTVVCTRCANNADEIVQQRQGDEGSSAAKIDSGGRTMVTFSPIGAPMSTNPADGSMPIGTIDFTSSVTMDALRPLRIVISPAGSVRMCDPDPKLPADDPRRCVM